MESLVEQEANRRERGKRPMGRTMAGLAVAAATVAALVVIAMAMYDALPPGATVGDSAPPGWYQLGGLLLVFVLLPGGLWCAWRVGSGRWNFSPKPSDGAAAEDRPGQAGVS